MPGPVITIARQLGSGGDEIAARVAERLGVPLLDREIISRAAQEADVSEEALATSQRSGSRFTRILENLARFGGAGAEVGVAEGFSSVTMLATSSDFRALVERALRDVAASGPAVIVGHAGQVALRGVPGTLHLFVHAPLDVRAARHAKAQNIPLGRARTEVEESDRERVSFFRQAYQVNWYDLRLYDLVIDTGLTGIRGATEMVTDLARRAAAIATESSKLPSEPTTVEAPEEGAATVTLDRDELRVRPMTAGDAGALLALFRSLPPQDLMFLKRDVTNELAIDAWARDVADGKVVTLLAETRGGELVGEASVRQSEAPWTRNVGEVRVVTSPEWRHRGLGRALLDEIMASARAAGMDKLTAEMMVEQRDARRLFERMGFAEEGRYRAFARDQEGRSHDLLVMTWTAPETEDEG